MRFTKLFEPLFIGKVYIKNRIAMAPMNNLHQFDPAEGTITQRCVDYYVERAKGGVGLLITGVFKVESEIEAYLKDGMMMWPLFTEKTLAVYAELSAYAHAYGAKVFVQLSAGPGRAAKGEAIDAGFRPVSASANPAFFRPDVLCRPLTTEEVTRLIAAFGRAAEIAVTAGLDGIEVHGHEGYLIDQFTTALWNRRTDKYGGSLKNRLRLPIEILGVIKDRTGNDFPVTYRYGVKHFIKKQGQASLRCGESELGRDVEEAVEIARLLQEAGYDALHLDAGCYESAYWAHPPTYQVDGPLVELVGKVKQAVRIPVIVAGKLGRPELAERVLSEGKADMIALGRPLLADPYWPAKVLKGDLADIRPCIGCHEGCLRRASTAMPLSCSVNPTCGREEHLRTRRSGSVKRILVVGAGVAGMEAARIAAARGHRVKLIEKTERVGGHLIEASVPEFKRDLRALLDWYKAQLDKAQVEIRLQTLGTVQYIENENPEVVVIATGSTPIIPDIPGIDSPIVVTNCDLLLGKRRAGSRVVVAGGGLAGCETALWLAQRGASVTIVEALPQVARNVHFANRTMLLDLLAESKVNVIVNSRLTRILDNGVVVEDENLDSRTLWCDTLVLALGERPNNELYEPLLRALGGLVEIYRIGDCKQPRRIHDAIWEGHIVGREV